MTASVQVDLVKILINNTGTGIFSLGAAVEGFRGQEALIDGDQYSYSVQQGANYETGTGIFDASEGTLSRSVINSSNGNTAISLASNAVLTFTLLARDFADIAAGAIAAVNTAGALQVTTVNNAGAAQVELVGEAGATATSEAEAAIIVARDAAILAAQAVNPLITARVFKPGDTVITSDATLTADPDLSFTLPAGGMYAVKGRLNYQTPSAAGLKWGLTGPASPASVQINRRATPPGGTDSGLIVDDAYTPSGIALTGGGSGISGAIEFEGTIINGPNAGPIVPVWAQNTSNGGNTVMRAGSYMEVVKLPIPLVVDFTDDRIGKLGVFTGPHTEDGPPYFYQSADGNSWPQFDFIGSKIYMNVFGNGSLTVTIDGVSTTITPPSSVFSKVDLTPSGVTDGSSHSFVVKNAAGLLITATAAFEVHGANPSITRNIPAYFPLADASFTAGGKLDGAPLVDTDSFGSTYPGFAWQQNAPGYGIRVQATTAEFWLFASNYAGMQWVLYQDGTQIGEVTLGNDITYAAVRMATGLSGSHLYTCVPIGGTLSPIANAQAAGYAQAVMVDAVDTTSLSAIPLDVHIGDSITAEIGITDCREGDAWQLAQAQGKSVNRQGLPSAPVAGYLDTHVAGWISGLPQAPARCFLRGGVVDCENAANLTTFQTQYGAMITAANGALPSNTPSYCFMTPYTGPNDTQYGAFNSAVAAAVSASGLSNFHYLNASGVINPATDTVDGVHPNAAGYAKLYAWLAANVPA